MMDVPPTVGPDVPVPVDPAEAMAPADAAATGPAPRPAPSGGGVERRPGGALSEAERGRQRRNRRWMAAIAIFALVFGGASLVASVLAGRTTPSVKPTAVPAGYKAVSDGTFAYAAPSGWSTNQAYTDDVGDLDTQGKTGWVAEHLGVRAAAPVAGEPPPSSFRAFGQPQPSSYHMGPARPTSVSGTTVAFRYELTRPGGFEATAVDTWQSASGFELWILIKASPATTQAILRSLNA